MNLRELPGDDDGDVAEGGLHVSKGLVEFVGCAVEDDGDVFGKRTKEFDAVGLFLRRVAKEHEMIGRQAGYSERGDCGSRAGDADDFDPSFDRFVHKPVPWIGDKGRPRVRNKRDLFSFQQLFNEPWSLLIFRTIIKPYH